MPGRRRKSNQQSNRILAENRRIENEGDEGTMVEQTPSRALPVWAAPTDSRYYTDAQKYLLSPRIIAKRLTDDRYWTSLPPTLDTMLGGFNNTRLPRVDIIGSRTFISHPTIRQRLAASSYAHAVDCGAGIGRITKNLLSKTFAKTDLIDPIESFNKDVMEGEYLRAEREAGMIGEVFTMGLQDFAPEKGKYSIIWNQWCLGHLRDDDLVEYFKRCKEGLATNGGVIIVKENLAVGQDVFDQVDSSYTRTEKSLKDIFAKAGLRLIHSQTQHGRTLGILSDFRLP
jgi:protein N-terminal methyltransferase